MLGPWLAGKISLKGNFRRAIDRIFGIDEMHEFRDDIQSIVGRHASIEIGERSAPQIRKNILDLHNEASRQAERGEFIVAIIAGAISLVAGFFTAISPLGLLLGIYSVMMTLTVGLHVVVLDILAYNESDDLSPYRRKKLVLLEGWNRVILSDHSVQAGILAVGVLHKVSPLGYEVAKSLLEDLAGEDLSKWQQVLRVSSWMANELGEMIKYKMNK
jgi:hypothetical protein